MLKKSIFIDLPGNGNELSLGTQVCQIGINTDELFEVGFYLKKHNKNKNLMFCWIKPNSFEIDHVENDERKVDVNLESEHFKTINLNDLFGVEKNSLETIMNQITDLVSEMKEKGYDGLCILVTIINDSKYYMDFIDAIIQLNKLYSSEQSFILYQYLLDESSLHSAIDLTANHRYILSKRNENWKLTENTLHQLIKKELEDAKEFYLTLFDEFPALIWRAGTDTLCNYFNHNWLEFTGRTTEQEYGNGWTEGVYPDDFQRCVDYYLENFRQRKPFSMEYRLKRHDGEYRWILDMGMPFYDLKGDFAGYIGSCYDVTERIHLEEKLRIAAEEAQKANLDKSLFLSRMSHEIRTPMNGIIGMLELLSLSNIGNEAYEYVKLAKNSSNVLIRIVNDLLDISRIEVGRMKLEVEEISLKSISDNVMKTFRYNNTKDIVLETHVAEEIPDILMGDAVRISQIIFNLVGNAMKFTDAGLIELSFSLQKETDKKVMIKGFVKDTGIGIPEDQRDKLFLNFSQLENSGPRKYKGSGLGLMITKLLVNQMGGEIHVESVEGQGSIFSFTLCLDKMI